MRPPHRTVDDKIRTLRHLGHLGRPAADQQAWQPVGTQRLNRGEGGQVTEVVADEHDRRRRLLGHERSYGVPFVTTGRSQLDHHAPGLHREAQLVGQRSQAGRHEIERGKRVGRATYMHSDRPPFVLDVGVRHAQLGEQRRHPGPRRRDGGVVRGCGDPATFPALQPVVAQHDEPVDVGEARVVDGDLGRSTGDHRDPAEAGREPNQRRGYVGVGARRVRVGDDRSQRAVEVEPQQRCAGAVEQRSETRATGLAGRGGQAHPAQLG